MIQQFTKVLIVLFATINCFAQTGDTKFIFLGIGDWDDVTLWKDELYPGNTIDPGENVTIQGEVTIPEGFVVTVTEGSFLSFFSDPSDETPNLIPIVTLNGRFVCETNASVGMSGARVLVSGTYENNGSLFYNEGNGFSVAPGGTIVNSGSFSLNLGLINNGIIENQTGGSISPYGITNRGTIRNSGSIFINELTNFESIINDNTVFTNSNSIIVNESGATFQNNKNVNLNLDSTFRNKGTWINSQNGTMEIPGLFVMEEQSSFSNLGTIDLIYKADLRMETDWENEGIVRSLSGGPGEFIMSRIRTNTYTLTNSGTIRNEGEILNETGIILNKETGTVTNNNAIINALDGQNFTNEGILEGNNISHIGNLVNNNGVLAPGSSETTIGTYVFTNDWIQSNTGTTLEIQIASETEFDQVRSEGAVELSGTLNVELIEGISDLTLNTEMTIIRGSTINGTFDILSFPELSDGKRIDIVYLDTEVFLKINDTTTDNTTTYTFIGDGDWNDSEQWKNNLVPGTTIASNDIVNIEGNIILTEDLTVTFQDFAKLNLLENSSVTVDGTLILNTESKVKIEDSEILVNGIWTTNGRTDLLNSKITISGRLENTGSFVGNCEIIVTEGSLVNTNTGSIMIRQLVNIGEVTNNGDLSVDTATNEGVLRTTKSFTATKTLINTETLTVSGMFEAEIFVNQGKMDNNGTIVTERLTNNDVITNTATIRSRFVRNEGTGRLTNDGFILFFGSIVNTGSITNNRTATLTNYTKEGNGIFTNTNSVSFRGQFNLDKSIINMNIIEISGEALLTENYINDATILVSFIGELSFSETTSVTLFNKGTLENEGDISFSRGVLNNDTSGTLINNSNFSGKLINRGVLTGHSSSHTGQLITTEGIISLVLPDAGVLRYSLDTNLNLGENSTLRVEIGDGVKATNLNVSGAFRSNLSGTLEVVLADDFDINAYDEEFEIKLIGTIGRGGDVRGQFTDVKLPELPDGKSFKINYRSDEVTLSIIEGNTLNTLNQNISTTSRPQMITDKHRNELYFSGLRGTVELTLYDLQGREIQTMQISELQRVSIQSLAPAHYIAKLEEKGTYRFVR